MKSKHSEVHCGLTALKMLQQIGNSTTTQLKVFPGRLDIHYRVGKSVYSYDGILVEGMKAGSVSFSGNDVKCWYC